MDLGWWWCWKGLVLISLLLLIDFMALRFCYPLAVLFLMLNSLSCMNNNSQFEYADGNGNVYTITSTTLKYSPVKPEDSSSGTYSGGVPKSIALTPDQFGVITAVLSKAVDNTTSHISERVMMSGAVSVIDGNNKNRYIIAPGSVEQKDIESTLKNILSQ